MTVLSVKALVEAELIWAMGEKAPPLVERRTKYPWAVASLSDQLRWMAVGLCIMAERVVGVAREVADMRARGSRSSMTTRGERRLSAELFSSPKCDFMDNFPPGSS